MAKPKFIVKPKPKPRIKKVRKPRAPKKGLTMEAIRKERQNAKKTIFDAAGIRPADKPANKLEKLKEHVGLEDFELYTVGKSSKNAGSFYKYKNGAVITFAKLSNKVVVPIILIGGGGATREHMKIIKGQRRITRKDPKTGDIISKLATTISKKHAREFFNWYYGNRGTDFQGRHWSHPDRDVNKAGKIDRRWRNKDERTVFKPGDPGSIKYLSRAGPKTFDIEGIDTPDPKKIGQISKKRTEMSFKRGGEGQRKALAGSKIYRRARSLAMREKRTKKVSQINADDIGKYVNAAIDELRKERYETDSKNGLFKAGDPKLSDEELNLWLQSKSKLRKYYKE